MIINLHLPVNILLFVKDKVSVGEHTCLLEVLELLWIFKVVNGGAE
jgi:hypothetical protein